MKLFTKIFILKFVIYFRYFFRSTKKKTNERRFNNDDQKKFRCLRISMQNFVRSILTKITIPSRQRKAYVLKFAYRSARRCPCGRVLIKNSFILNSISSDYEQVVRAHIFWEKNSKKFHILYAMRRKEINKIDI